MPDGSAFEFTQKANAVPTTVGGVTKDAKSSGEVAPTINTASENSIPTSDGNVNAKFSLKGMDSAYLAAVERGDTEAAQNAKTAAGEGSGNGSVVAIVTVEEHSSRVASIDYVDVTHSISGRLRKNESSRSSTREKGYGLSAAPTTATYNISIADFLDIVNETYRSILSDDVLRHYGEERPADGYYSDRVLFQLKSARELEQEVRELKKERTALLSRNKTLEARVEKWRKETRRSSPSVRADDVKKMAGTAGRM